MRKGAGFIIPLVLVLAVPALPASGEDADRVVVELFTSQGCPACPPAEALLRELAPRDDVIALEYHIDYYDYAGWKDPFATPEFTQRWHRYAQSLGARYDYTPFLVVDGMAHLVGSERTPVERLIRQRTASGTSHPRIVVRTEQGGAVVTIDGTGPPGLFDVMLAGYDRRHETRVTAGENRGKTLVNANVVRDFRRIAQWSGEPVTLRISRSDVRGDGGCAILLQRANGGPILTAAAISF